ncbi:MAG TPA: metalloregulator ArsR/SmtB family transcription factor [Myxococcota bacterium]|nr:metalloregulator ArsR/SmtB family transcription factor [Myxococcota bacterium]
MQVESETREGQPQRESWREALALKPYLHAIADPTRLSMLLELAHTGERQVLELARLLGLSQPLASWHLRILRQAGLVSTRRLGRQVLCRLNRERLGEYKAQLDALMNV